MLSGEDGLRSGNHAVCSFGMGEDVELVVLKALEHGHADRINGDTGRNTCGCADTTGNVFIGLIVGIVVYSIALGSVFIRQVNLGLDECGAKNMHLNIGDAANLHCKIGCFSLDNIGVLGCVMANKTSIRFFEDVPVRAVWDDESAKWWFCAMDIAEALTKTTNPRVYWATVKRRNPQLIAICKQLKLKAKDGKFYNTDVLDEGSLNTVLALIPSKKADVFAKWMKNMEDYKGTLCPYK